MNMHRLLILACTCLFIVACDHIKTTDSGDSRSAVAKAEKDFEKMVAEKGVAEAFWFFADSTAVIKRQNDTLISGRDAIRNYYAADHYKTASVKWTPDFIDVSASGDMGYTFGKYTWQFRDSAGKVSDYSGVFHTVWKKQPDGNWKYVWD